MCNYSYILLLIYMSTWLIEWLATPSVYPLDQALCCKSFRKHLQGLACIYLAKSYILLSSCILFQFSFALHSLQMLPFDLKSIGTQGMQGTAICTFYVCSNFNS